ncbi:3-hydroxyacyl-CoA dehydrogenase NAD-binding domain-containing protein [Castellaniella caeni]|uniref:3-hydroxyacyl-CoA dehydrogenase NAD-binding domain-containing protein n=1 Tax=Castellaniella caeni TaxID=266123 RepID=UPI0008307DA5|nr:3-hydroxyacyl-CoA dehydrogenase NAD-binding domain-containing protein [Castellaniella caeni]
MTDPRHPSVPAVTWRREGPVLLVTIDHPPVNALGVEVRRGLLAALDAAQADVAVQAVLLLGKGRNFIAGADIREFGQPPQAPLLTDVCNRIEACPRPVIAAVQGAAFGGGLEVVLAAHYRLAVPGAKFALPEVTLGLLPGAGGTQRAPRLIGVEAALKLMLDGKPVAARQAADLGLVDRLATGTDPQAEGLAYAHELLAAGAAVRPTRDRAIAADAVPAARQAIEAARGSLNKKHRGLFSPARIVDAVEAVLDVPFDEGLRLERSFFLQCLDTPQRAALVHAFFAEREAAKVPEAGRARPRSLERIGIVGGGTMGAGIAVAMLDAGLPVVMIERDDPSLARGQAHVAKVYDSLVQRGRLDAAERDRRLTLFSGSTDYAALAQADLVVEAVFEDMAVKSAVFAELDRVCKPGAVLASNTSYLDINALAKTVARPQDVIGLHFFSPANIMKLLEIVVPEQVADDVVATGFALAKRLKKVAVRAGVCDGFIGNRILAVYRQAADYLLADGASPYQIDQAVRHFGFPMGPFQVTDLAGGDIGWATRKRRAATRDPLLRYVPAADRLCERGWFGQKTGRGWYLYPDGARVGQEDPEVLAIVAEVRQQLGAVQRTFTEDEILRRYLAAMINEGANVVHQGIALRPLDVDVAMLYGYGFPRHRGGPLHYADQVGLDKILADIHEFAAQDPHFWKPSPLLLQLVAQGRRFQDLNQLQQD